MLHVVKENDDNFEK